MVYKITVPILNYNKDGIIEVSLLFYSHEGGSPTLEAFLAYLGTMDPRTYRESLRKAAINCDRWIVIKDDENLESDNCFTIYDDIKPFTNYSKGYPITFRRLSVIKL